MRLDGVKLGICEVMGLELDEPRLGSFAGALNALDFPVQLLVRQHPPVLDRPEGCPKGSPARRPAAEDRTSRGVPSWPAQGPRDPGGGAGQTILRCMPA